MQKAIDVHSLNTATNPKVVAEVVVVVAAVVEVVVVVVVEEEDEEEEEGTLMTYKQGADWKQARTFWRSPLR